MVMIKDKLVVEITVPYHEYKTATLNKRAHKEVKRWIKEVLENELNYIPLWVEEDPGGGHFEDSTGLVKFKIKEVEDK